MNIDLPLFTLKTPQLVLETKLSLKLAYAKSFSSITGIPKKLSRMSKNADICKN